MSEGEWGRIQGDLATMRRAIGLQMPFGKEALVYDVLLAIAAVVACLFSLLAQYDPWLQLGPLAAIMVAGLVGLFLHAQRTDQLSHELKLQVVLSITIYAVVWIAACGYTLAAALGRDIGPVRTALLHATSISILLLSTLALIRAAIAWREQRYCLGLALATLMTGMVLPIDNPLVLQYRFPLCHFFMAAGYWTMAAAQWRQLKKVVIDHAAY